MNPWIALAGVNGAMAIALAAYGAHGVDAALAPLVERASQFQLIHAVALLSVGRLAGEGRKWATAAGVGMVLGVALFSGSLYFKAIWGALPVPMVTPAGGISLILGWVLLVVASIGRARPSAI